MVYQCRERLRAYAQKGLPLETIAALLAEEGISIPLETLRSWLA